jgi:hypothetical protein
MVEVFDFRNGEGTLLESGKVRLKRSPFVSFFVSLVAEHGLLYGCLVVVLALLAGLLTGYVFGRGKGGTH